MTNTTPPYQPESVDMVEADDSAVKATMYSSSSFKEDVDNSMNTQAVPLYSILQMDKPESTPTDNFATTYSEPTPSYPELIETTEKTEPQLVYESRYTTTTELKLDEPPVNVPDTLYTTTTAVETAAVPESPVPQPDVGILTTGQRLRQLREQKHLTIQNVADKLYLDNSVIQALENDSYEALPPPIFVRGYLRGYAKILEVPATALIEKYDSHVGHKPPPPITSQAKPKKQATTNDLWVKVLTYGIFLTLMVLMVLWGVSHYALLSPASDANSSNTSPQGENLSVGEGEYVPPSEGDDDKPPAAGQPLVSNPPPPPPPVTPPPPPVDLRALKIYYPKNGAWTRVVDAKGAKAYEGTPKTGETIDVKGEPPFKVKFGANNAGIEIEYKGQKAAAETYPKSNKNIMVGEAIPATPPAPPTSPTPAPTHTPAPPAHPPAAHQ